MIGFSEINLINFINTLEEEKVKNILLEFKSPLNKDIEGFLHNKAIEFCKQGIAHTHLIFASYKNELVLVGYYTLSNKYVPISKKQLSNTLRKKLSKFGQYNPDTKQLYISMPLIAQLGKNYNKTYNKLITGDEILKRACDNIRKIQSIVGGKYVYLECEDKSKLIEFYETNGFVSFGSRPLDKDETDSLDGTYLIQLLKKL